MDFSNKPAKRDCAIVPQAKRDLGYICGALIATLILAPQIALAKSTSSVSSAKAATSAKSIWPADVRTRHSIVINGKPFAFSATAGYVTLRNGNTRKPIADIAFIAFTRDGADARQRPVTFVFNGGPGYASAWLNLGAMGPWRISMEGEGLSPSARPKLSDNQESWLPFSDLVFIDPAGTGYGRIHDKDATGTLWSVKGDINALATTIRRWIESNGRTASPKFIAGESYGGFRVPLITHELQTDQGIGVNGQILISPVLDFASRRFGGAMSHVALLPSLVATAKSAKAPEGKITRADLTSTEDYARSEFLTDLVKGRSNLDAVSRLADKVSKLTGLERSLVAQRAGRIPMNVFIREFYRSSGRIASVYDARVSGLDPDRHSARNKSEDQLRLGLHAPIIQAMSGLYRDKLKWIYPDGRYMFQSKSAGSSWKWGRRPPESVSELASTLALDPEMRVLITHGLTDLVTPYFATQLTLDDMPKISGKQRVKFQVYPGGHMFYSQEASRKAFRDDARKMIKAAAER